MWLLDVQSAMIASRTAQYWYADKSCERKGVALPASTACTKQAEEPFEGSWNLHMTALIRQACSRVTTLWPGCIFENPTNGAILMYGVEAFSYTNLLSVPAEEADAAESKAIADLLSAASASSADTTNTFLDPEYCNFNENTYLY